MFTCKHSFFGITSPAYNIWVIDTDEVNPSYLELDPHSPSRFS